jgi:hypothetical protein
MQHLIAAGIFTGLQSIIATTFRNADAECTGFSNNYNLITPYGA